MKTKIFLFTGLLLLFYCGNLSSEEVSNKNNASLPGSLTVYCTPDLYELTSQWAGEYSNLNPESRIKVVVVSDVNAALAKDGHLSFISNDLKTSGKSGAYWKMPVGRDVIVPIINSNNPYLDEISQRGISSAIFAQMFEYPDKQVWGSLLENGQNVPVHLYLINDISVKRSVERFLNINQMPIEGIRLADEKEIITAIQNDPYAIGFCKMVNILDPENQSIVDNIKLIPIDKNGNGRIDYIEKIYDDLNVFARGVWIGKYPRALFTDIYSVSSVQPANEAEIAFLKWVLTGGQQFLYLNGFSDLAYSERQSKLDKISNYNNIYVTPAKEVYSIPKLALLILTALIILSIIISVIVRYSRKEKVMASVASPLSLKVFDENSVVVPKGLYFDRTHTWAFMEKDGAVKIGIDDFLQHVTGPVTRIEMKQPGEKIKKGELFLSIIQEGKQLSLYSPISGTIKEQNKLLVNNASIINSSPYSEGWVYMIEPADWLKEIRLLSMAEKYIKWLPEEFLRLKDFLAVALNADRVQYAKVVLQDGGVLRDNILADFGPEVWEDFQTDFIDTYK